MTEGFSVEGGQRGPAEVPVPGSELSPASAEINGQARVLFEEMDGWFRGSLTPAELTQAYVMKSTVVPGGSVAWMGIRADAHGELSDVVIQAHTSAPDQTQAPKSVRRRDFEIQEGGAAAGYQTIQRPENYSMGSAHWTEQAGSSETLTRGLQFAYESATQPSGETVSPPITVQRGHEDADPNITEAELAMLEQVASGVPASLTGVDITREDVAQPGGTPGEEMPQ
ncbi:MAG TPA: hypothetical protein VF466_02030 [Candidatus Saccharimonadales bacterium]